MNQMQSFIEKAKTDKDLMTKLNALGASGASMDKVVALAAEHGFTISEEDCRMAVETPCPSCLHNSGEPAAELSEEDLEAAAGGYNSRHDPSICSQYKEVGYNCVGFLGLSHCNWYQHVAHRDSWGVVISDEYYCRMGFYYRYTVNRY